jgi:hypothetical protein
MEINRLHAGLTLLVVGFACIVAYLVVSESSVGPISDLLGLAFVFNFIGLLVVVGHLMNWYPGEGS